MPRAGLSYRGKAPSSYNLSVSLRSTRPGCGSQHPPRSACVLLAAAPTAPPCFRHWRRSSPLPLVGEPLAKPFTLRGLPKPLPLGEVSPKVTERASPAGKSRRRSDGQALCQSDTIAVSGIRRQHPCPLSRACARQLSQRESLCLRGLREFVENARVKREEFVNVIKMRRRY